MGTPQNVVDFFLHPPVALMKRSTTTPTTIPNPLSGSGSLSITVLPASAFGIHWAINTAPAGAGRSARSVLEYEQDFWSFSLHYTLGDGSDFLGDTVKTGLAEGFWLWAIALPSSLTYDILPGFTVHLDWLVGRTAS